MKGQSCFNFSHGLVIEVAQPANKTRLIQGTDMEDQDDRILVEARFTGGNGHSEQKTTSTTVGSERHDRYRWNPLIGQITLNNQHGPCTGLLDAYGGIQIGQEDITTAHAHLGCETFLSLEQGFIFRW